MPTVAQPWRPADREKIRVALASLAATMGIFLFKLLVAWHSHSLGILAEAAHSALDLLATLLTFASIRIAARPADANHPFGHGKFENFSAFLQTGLLILTAVAIAYAALRSWFVAADTRLHLDLWAFAVMAVSIAVDLRRSAVLRRAATVHHSDALAADALNFSTDLAGSAAVLIGLTLVALGRHFGWNGLRHADAAAALAVAGAMCYLAVRLGRRTAGVLLDEAPPALSAELRHALDGVEGVSDLNRLRLRRVGGRYFVDLQMAIDPASTLAKAGQIRHEVAERIQRRLPEADVVIETQPRPLAPSGPYEQVQAIALRENLNIHDLAVYDLGSGLDVEFHLELRESLPLAAAHDLVSRLEAAIHAELPDIRLITTHIEPEAAHVSSASLLDPGAVARRVQELAHGVPDLLDCHDIQLRRSGGHLSLSCHCTFPDSAPVGRVHELASRLEADIKRAMPQLLRVTIHPEPGSDNRR